MNETKQNIILNNEAKRIFLELVCPCPGASFFLSNHEPGLILTIFMTVSNLFPEASVWPTAYTILSAVVFPSFFFLIQYILSTQVIDTGPMVVRF